MKKSLAAVAAVLMLSACGVEAAPSTNEGGGDGGEETADSSSLYDAQQDAGPEEEPLVEEEVDVQEEPAVAAGTYGSDPTLDARQDACEGGDSGACDDLYWDSPLDSEYEATAERLGANTSIAEPDPGPQLSMAQENAVSKAQEYLDYASFSRSGLIEQLEYEGFRGRDAEFAVDQITVNWRTQAAEKAQEYLDYSSFSRSGLIEQLQYEGFSPAQAEYGVNQTGLR